MGWECAGYAQLARAAGLTVQKSSNAGGWVALAKACGLQFSPKRSGPAKVALYLRFGIVTKHGAATPRKSVDKGYRYVGRPSPRPQSKFSPTAPGYAGDVNHPDFLQSFAWRQVRMVALKKWGAVCQCCGASPATGAVMNVDHIKPRRKYPHLALDESNLQVLCGDCNHGKGSWDQTDWRPTESDDWADDDDAAAQHMRDIALEV